MALANIHKRAAHLAAGVGAAVALVIGLSLYIGGGFGLWLSLALLLSASLGSIWLCYTHAERLMRAYDDASARLLSAAQGDLSSPVSMHIETHMPDLAHAMHSVFSKVRVDLDAVQTLAMFDPVTGLANRTSFCRQVERILLEQPPAGPAPMMFIDLDGFKAVNDTLGHATGDQLLVRVAGRLREAAMAQAQAGNSGAVIGRLAGDEFTMFFPSMPPEVSAMQVGRSIKQALSEPYDMNGSQVEIGASIGVAYYPEHGTSLAALLRSADHAMYDAKNNGRKRVQLYTKDLELRIAGRTEQEREIRHALERDEFLLEFQPQIDFGTGQVIGAEALVRWAHPNRDLMLPETFVPLAEETGLIVELGEWIMGHVCQTATRWAAVGVTHRLSINISARELAQPDFFVRFAAAMERHGTPADMLELELTESLIPKLQPHILDALISLRNRGVHIAVDNFGTGFSNLSRLKDMPIDRVKIDRRLVSDIARSEEARTICSAVVGLIKQLGLDIVVEGVESEDQIEILRVMGCMKFQGFHLSRPIEESRYFEKFGSAEVQLVIARS